MKRLIAAATLIGALLALGACGDPDDDFTNAGGDCIGMTCW